MMLKLSVAIVLLMGLLGSLASVAADHNDHTPSSRYMGGPAELATAPNGAIVNKEVLEFLPQTGWTVGPEIENPAEGVYVLGGYLISACIVIAIEIA